MLPLHSYTPESCNRRIRLTDMLAVVVESVICKNLGEVGPSIKVSALRRVARLSASMCCSNAVLVPPMLRRRPIRVS